MRWQDDQLRQLTRENEEAQQIRNERRRQSFRHRREIAKKYGLDSNEKKKDSNEEECDSTVTTEVTAQCNCIIS